VGVLDMGIALLAVAHSCPAMRNPAMSRCTIGKSEFAVVFYIRAAQNDTLYDIPQLLRFTAFAEKAQS